MKPQETNRIARNLRTEITRMHRRLEPSIRRVAGVMRIYIYGQVEDSNVLIWWAAADECSTISRWFMDACLLETTTRRTR